jgi:peptidoglycan/xylan/chitin deacetylase (PgdA/CDA1 family)
MTVIPVEFFPLNPVGKPFKAPGSMITAYPDFRHYSTRDYGNRVGIYRFLKLFSKIGLKGSFAVNSQVAERYPGLISDIIADGHEIIAHGINMDTLHYGGLDEKTEATQINTCINTIEAISKQTIKGWISPAYSQSFNTPDLLSAAGIEYCGDWANDDLPYTMRTKNGELINIPVAQEISDRQIITNNHHTEESYVQQLKDQYELLQDESSRFGGRMMSITIHPYIMGLPYRINALKEILEWFMQSSTTWSATSGEIVTAFNKSKK